MSRTKFSVVCVALAWGCAVLCTKLIAEESDNPFGEAEGPVATAPAHAKENTVLKAGAAPAVDYGKELEFCQCVDDLHSDARHKIEKTLRGPLVSSGLDFSDAHLNDVVSQLQDEYGIPIQLDKPALDANGIRVDEPVTVNLHNISLQSALRLILKNLQLTYIIADEVLVITTPDEAEKRLQVCVYDVRGIVGSDEQALNALIRAITASTAHETWSENGGTVANIQVVKPSLLVISQTQSVHEEIRNLLSTIRSMQGEAAAMPIRADDKTPSADEVVTRSYLLQLGQSDNFDAMRTQVRELIVGALPDEVWSGRLAGGQPVTLTVFQDRIVVRQTPAVQEKVQKILADSGIAALAPVANPGGMGGGGFGGGGGGMGGSGGGGGGGGFFSPAPAPRTPSHENGAPDASPFQ